MITRMKTAKTRITITLISVTLALICSVMFMSVLGLSIQDSIHIQAKKEPFPIYLNAKAFRTAEGTPNAAWFIIDEHSLSPISKHSIKVYRSKTFKPEVSNAYYPYIRKENHKLLAYTVLFFMLACGAWFYGLNRTFGTRYAESFFIAGRNSVADPTPPYMQKIGELKMELQGTNDTIRDLKGKLSIYEQEKGPIRVETLIISSEELKACKKLGISPKEYIDKHKRKRASGSSEGISREHVKF